MILRCFERCKALWTVWRSGEQQLSTVGLTPRRRAGDILTFACTPSHFSHLRSLRGILCGFTAIISSKRLSPSVPKYNQHRVFLAQTVTEAVGLISCKITFQLYCTYCCTIERYSEKYKHGEGKCWVDGIVTRECSNYGSGWRWVSSLQSRCSSVQTKVTCLLSYTASHYRQRAHPSLVFQARPALERCLYTVRHLRNVTVIVIWAE